MRTCRRHRGDRRSLSVHVVAPSGPVLLSDRGVRRVPAAPPPLALPGHDSAGSAETFCHKIISAATVVPGVRVVVIAAAS